MIFLSWIGRDLEKGSDLYFPTLDFNDWVNSGSFFPKIENVVVAFEVNCDFDIIEGLIIPWRLEVIQTESQEVSEVS